MRPALLVPLVALSVAMLPAASLAIEDAEIIALELSGELLAPVELTETIATHLAAIRAVRPVLTVVHARFEDWEVGDLAVELTATAMDDFLNGTYTGLDSLHAAYGPVAVKDVFEEFRTVFFDFDVNYNPEVLGPIYEAHGDVVSTHPNGLYGDGPDITSDSLGTYLFRFAWGTCPTGCTFERFWLYVIDVWGDPAPGLAASEPGSVPQLVLGAVRPNPVGAAATIAYSLERESDVRLDVLDVVGRRVRSLPGGFRSLGAHEVSWDGLPWSRLARPHQLPKRSSSQGSPRM